MLLFNPVELTELIQLTHERIDDLHALEELGTAFLVASVLLTLCGVVFALQVSDLILESVNITLLSSQFHHFLPQVME